MEVKGVLSVTPELSWDQLKNTKYIPFDLHVAQGRNSAMCSDLKARLQERMVRLNSQIVETGETEVFVKYAEEFEYEHRWNDSLSLLTHHIQQLIETFPEHTIEGAFEVSNDDHQYRVVVKDGEILVLKPQKVWLTVGKRLKSRKWTNEDEHTRLKRANELLRLIRVRGVKLCGHDQQEICDEDCLRFQVDEHLMIEGVDTRDFA